MMFLETAIALFALGFLSCVLLARAEIIRLRRQIKSLRRAEIRAIRERNEAHRAGTYRGNLRAAHNGTPYIAPLPTDLERVLTDISDNDRWSRKAPGLRSVS